MSWIELIKVAAAVASPLVAVFVALWRLGRFEGRMEERTLRQEKTSEAVWNAFKALPCAEQAERLTKSETRLNSHDQRLTGAEGEIKNHAVRITTLEVKSPPKGRRAKNT
ncbi:MAG: hypothetical protein ABSG68_11365 [Thermoguttaceae bacterium]|jgi:hypothetical protein